VIGDTALKEGFRSRCLAKNGFPRRQARVVKSHEIAILKSRRSRQLSAKMCKTNNIKRLDFGNPFSCSPPRSCEVLGSFWEALFGHGLRKTLLFTCFFDDFGATLSESIVFYNVFGGCVLALSASGQFWPQSEEGPGEG